MIGQRTPTHRTNGVLWGCTIGQWTLNIGRMVFCAEYSFVDGASGLLRSYHCRMRSCRLCLF